MALSMAAVPFTDSVPLSGGQALGHELDQLLPSRPRTPTAPYLATTSSRADRTIRVSISARTRPAVTVITPSRNGVQAILALGRGLNSVPPLLHQIVLNELDRAPGTERRLERLRYHQNVPLTVLLAVIGNSYLSVRRVGADHQQRGATAEFDQRLRCSAHHGLKVHGIRRVC